MYFVNLHIHVPEKRTSGPEGRLVLAMFVRAKARTYLAEPLPQPLKLRPCPLRYGCSGWVQDWSVSRSAYSAPPSESPTHRSGSRLQSPALHGDRAKRD